MRFLFIFCFSVLISFNVNSFNPLKDVGDLVPGVGGIIKELGDAINENEKKKKQEVGGEKNQELDRQNKIEKNEAKENKPQPQEKVLTEEKKEKPVSKIIKIDDSIKRKIKEAEENLQRKKITSFEGLSSAEYKKLAVDMIITDKQAEYNTIIYDRDGSIPLGGRDRKSGPNNASSRGWAVADEFKDVVSNVTQKKGCSIKRLHSPECSDPKKKSVSKQLIRTEFLKSKAHSLDGYGGYFCSTNRTYRCSGKQEWLNNDLVNDYSNDKVIQRSQKRSGVPEVKKAKRDFLYCPEEKFITTYNTEIPKTEQPFEHLRKFEDDDTKLIVITPYKDEWSQTVGMHGYKAISFDKKNEKITEVRRVDAVDYEGRPPYKSTFSGQCERFLKTKSLKCNMENKEKREKKYSHNYKVDSDLNFFGMLDELKELKGNENLLKKHKENMKTEITDEELKIKNLSTGFYTVKLNLTNGKVVMFGSNENEIINRGQCKP